MVLAVADVMPHITGALLLAVVFMALGIFIKRTLLKNTIMPPSLIAGSIALAIGPQGLGQLGLQGGSWLPSWTPDWVLAGIIPEAVITVWSELPGPLITLVFASLFIGRKIPSIREIWRESAPNLAYGYSLAFGQYTAGLLVGWAIIETFMGASAMTGLLIPIGFQGGHGTVAGLQQVLSPIDAAAVDLGYGMATIGIITAAVWGTFVSNFSRAKHYEKEQPDDHLQNDPDEENSEQQQSRPSITIPVALIGLAIAIGWFMLRAGDSLAKNAGLEGENPVSAIVPLFPLAMLAGLILQVLVNRWGEPECIDRRQVSGLSDVALSLLVVTALGSLDLQVLGQNWQILLSLGVAGVAISLTIYALIGRLVFGKNWMIRALGELGQSMGTTAIGLLLIKRTGPDGWLRSFSYKQPAYEPIVGGGLMTGLAVPMVSGMGVVVSLLLFAFLWFASMFAAWWIVRRRAK